MTLFLVGCENKISSTPETQTETGSPQTPVSTGVYTLNYSGADVVSAASSTDPRVATCATAGGLYLIDPNTTDAYCIKVDKARWDSKLAEFNQTCAADPAIVEGDRRIIIFNQSTIDTQLLELESVQIMCPNSFGFYGCEVGNSLYFNFGTDDLTLYPLGGCS